MQYIYNGFLRRTGIVSDPSQRNVLSRFAAVITNGAIVVAGLGTCGIDTSPLIAAAGVTGATIGFACRDYGANIVAGVALVGQPCFITGKRISLGVGANKMVGVIDHWDIRYLYLRGDNGELIMVPNNFVLNSVVTVEKPKQEDIEATWKNASSTHPSAGLANGATAVAGSVVGNSGRMTAEDRIWEAAAKKAQQEKDEKAESTGKPKPTDATK